MDTPAPPSATFPALQQRRASILASISAIGELRPGTVSEIYTKCGRPACHCQQQGDRGHGPYFRLVFNAAGHQTTRSLSARHVEVVRAEVAECQRLRRLTGELIEVSEQLSDARLQSADPGSAQRPSKKSLRAGIRPRHRSRTRPLRSSRGRRLRRFRGPRDPSVCANARWDWPHGRSNGASTTTSAISAARPNPAPAGRPHTPPGRRAKTFETVLGALTLRRADYHCPDCHHGSFPRDRALDMARTDLSPGVTRMTGAAAALVSFAQASGLLADLASVRVGTKHLQRTAEALGRQLAARERQAPDVPAPPPAPTA